MRASHTDALHVRLTPSMRAALDAEARVAGVNLSAATRNALAMGLRNQGRAPRRDHFLDALEHRQPGAVSTLLAAVPSDPSDPINRAWTQTVFVDEAEVLAQFAADELGLTTSDLRSVIASARSLEG